MTAHVPRPILVGIDDGHDSITAVRLAASEARLRRRPLELISAFPAPTDAVPPDAAWPPRDAARRRMIGASAVIRGVHGDIDLDARMVAGDLADHLIAGSRWADRVVVAADGAATANRGPDGVATVVPRLVARCAVPVYVVPVRGGAPGGPVLVGVAGDDCVPTLLEHAFEEAALRGVPLRAVHVWSAFPRVVLCTVDPCVYSPGAAAERADRVLAEALAGWQAKYPEVELQRQAVPGAGVEHSIATLTDNASMLMVSARVHGDHLLGPVTSGLLADPRCPLVVIPDRP